MHHSNNIRNRIVLILWLMLAYEALGQSLGQHNTTTTPGNPTMISLVQSGDVDPEAALMESHRYVTGLPGPKAQDPLTRMRLNVSTLKKFNFIMWCNLKKC